VSIHPLAAVSPKAKIAPDVQIGPFCVVERDARIAAGCILESGSIIKHSTTLGPANRVCEGAVVGGLPQHTQMPDNPGGLVIGAGNTIRENVTIHRALEAGKFTYIGDNNLLMVNVHVAHDCRLDNQSILTNNVMLAGHVTVADRAYLSGGAAAHQFSRIGALAMVGGQAHLVKDVPPCVTVDGLSSLVVGLNYVGLRRAGYDPDAIGQLKAAYRVIYRSGLTWSEILRRLKVEFPDGPAAVFYEFCSTTKRGITPERRQPPTATLKLHGDAENRPQIHAKAG